MNPEIQLVRVYEGPVGPPASEKMGVVVMVKVTRGKTVWGWSFGRAVHRERENAKEDARHLGSKKQTPRGEREMVKMEKAN